MKTRVIDNSVISMVDIVMDFAGTKALKGVSFDIEQQNIFGLLGPSGAGKTTIIKILTGQLRATSGQAYVNSINSQSLNDETYSMMGLILDRTGLYERLSVWQNLSTYADIYGVNKALIPKSLEEVGLLEERKKPVSKLSKGMRQRLSIARATLHKPSILFLDEPTSGLDPMTMKQIHENILELRDRGTTIFLTTHNMEEAHKLCNKVALLNEGFIVDMDEPDRLCRKYNKRNEIEIILKDGNREVLPNSPQSAETIMEYFSKDQVESIHSSEPNLETVFIHLTGRGLL